MKRLFSDLLSEAVTERRATATFIVFLVIHITMWTLLPALTRHDLDVDSLIQYAWGQEWQWSYYQQPPLLSWVVAGYLEVLGTTRFNYILLSQINIAVAFIAIWYLAKNLLPPVQGPHRCLVAGVDSLL